MRLFTQLVIILGIFMTVLATTIIVQGFNNSMTYIQNQLYTDSVNTSHWLGLSLSTSQTQELAAKESLIDAAYDSGYYENITLFDINGNVLYSREDHKTIYEVPEWFVNAIHIENKVAKSDIIINWRRFGSIEVSSHSGLAYYQLYKTFLHFSNTFLITGVLGFLVLYFLLHLSLRSLTLIEKQAEKIKDNIFVIQDKLPFTTEFKSVSIAINSMIIKFKDIFEKESETMHQYQELLYKDMETNIYNRKYLAVKFEDYIQENSELGSGAYMMYSIDGMNHLKREYGYEHYHKVLKHFVNNIQTVCKEGKEHLFVRLNENDFLLITPSSDLKEIAQKAHNILDLFRKELHVVGASVEKYFKVGCAIGNYTQEDTLTRLLSKADNAVSLANAEGNFSVYIDQTDEDTLVLGREELRNELLKSMYELRLVLESKPVVHIVNEKQYLSHKKVLLKHLDAEGKEQKLTNFMPIAIEMGISDKLDYYLMKRVFESIHQTDFNDDIAVTLSVDFIKQSTHINWLVDKLTALRKDNKEQNIWFSVSNTTAMQETESVKKFAFMIKSLGHRFGIDNFILPETQPKYLQILRPDFLRINTLYIYDMTYGDGSESTRRNLLNIVKSIGSEIVATHVDESSDISKVFELGITHFQGTAISLTNSI